MHPSGPPFTRLSSRHASPLPRLSAPGGAGPELTGAAVDGKLDWEARDRVFAALAALRT